MPPVNPIDCISVGATGEETTVVVPELTVGHLHPGMPMVYGTPFMIYLMEVAASNAVQSSLPAGCVTVGVDVSIRHMAATPIGRTVKAAAKVTGVTERLILFEVEAHDGVNVIGRGTHSRAPIDLKRFEASLADRR